MNDHWSGCDTVVPAWASRARRKSSPRWTPEQRKQLKDLWFVKPKLTHERIAEIIETKPQNISIWAKKLGLPRRIAERGKGRIGKRIHRSDETGQRRKIPLKASSGPRLRLEPHDPRARTGSTVYPTTVLPVSRQPKLLKSGHNSYKIGAKLTKGRWAGQQIFTLTLEERATCPRSCKEWLTCYGNNMPFAERIFDDGTLTTRLWAELAALSAKFPDGFIVRLHVLGDFFSVEYVDFWRQALEDFPKLNIFGFTARQAPDPIGIALLELTAKQYERFRMRFSAGGHKTDCSEVVDAAEDVNFVRCPAETDPKRCCASCGLCMQSNVSISFVRH